jgi:hypothetical protein
MKGCLSLIIKLIIAVLVFIGLMHLGVIDFIKEKIDEHNNNTSSQERMIEKTKDVVDLSNISDEYTIDKNLKILKNRMIIAEHNATGQKMIMIEPKKSDMLTQEDIKSSNAQEKIDTILNLYKYKLVKFDKIEVLKHGNFEGINQSIPYVKVLARISNLPVKDMEGIVGVAKVNNGKNLIVISASEKGKYSQIITDAFYKKVK